MDPETGQETYMIIDPQVLWQKMKKKTWNLFPVSQKLFFKQCFKETIQPRTEKYSQTAQSIAEGGGGQQFIMMQGGGGGVQVAKTMAELVMMYMVIVDVV